MPVKPFRIAIPPAKLDAIARRVREYPWYPAPAGEGWEFGCNTEALKSLCAYWLDGYDWRAQEGLLNAYPQFTVPIDGLDIHFVHVRGEGDAAKRPLILTHGWPGSHFEFWGVIEALAFPSRSGGDPKDAFDLIIPSLPGYGFSGKPKTVIGQRATARLWNTLMTEHLGYRRYLAQGGDWGSLVTAFLGLDHTACAGIHINMFGLAPADPKPQTDAEKAWIAAMAVGRSAESGYSHQQQTKPQSLAMGMMDSPVGVAAWILEKFHGWSDLRRGGLEAVYTRDQLLTNIMIYLVTDSFATSVWYYRGRLEENFRIAAGQRIEPPVGVAAFQGEPVFKFPPRTWVERLANIAHWSDIPEGGHYAAMERPDLFAPDVVKFARTIGY